MKYCWHAQEREKQLILNYVMHTQHEHIQSRSIAEIHRLVFVCVF